MTDSEDAPKIKVEFAPGCFDEFEGTQEELDEMIAEITRMAETGELFENSTLIEDCEDLTQDELVELNVRLDNLEQKRRLH